MTYSHTLEAYRDAREMERWSIIDCSDDEAREERRKAQQERMIERGIELAYEDVERTARCCDMEELK